MKRVLEFARLLTVAACAVASLVAGCGSPPAATPTSPVPQEPAVKPLSGIVVVTLDGTNCVVETLDPFEGTRTPVAAFDLSHNTPDSPPCPTEGEAKAPLVFAPDFQRLAAIQVVPAGGKSLGWLTSEGAFEPVAPVQADDGWETMTTPFAFGFGDDGVFVYAKRLAPTADNPEWQVRMFSIPSGGPANGGEQTASYSVPYRPRIEFRRDEGEFLLKVGRADDDSKSSECGLSIELSGDRHPNRAVFYFFARGGTLFKAPKWCNEQGAEPVYTGPEDARIFNVVASPCGDQVAFQQQSTFRTDTRLLRNAGATLIPETPVFVRWFDDRPVGSWGFYRWLTCP